jgi:hypothetical protein
MMILPSPFCLYLAFHHAMPSSSRQIGLIGQSIVLWVSLRTHGNKQSRRYSIG